MKHLMHATHTHLQVLHFPPLRLDLSVPGLEYQQEELPRLLVALWPSALELTQEVWLAARAEN